MTISSCLENELTPQILSCFSCASCQTSGHCLFYDLQLELTPHLNPVFHSTICIVKLSLENHARARILLNQPFLWAYLPLTYSQSYKSIYISICGWSSKRHRSCENSRSRELYIYRVFGRLALTLALDFTRWT